MPVVLMSKRAFMSASSQGGSTLAAGHVDEHDIEVVADLPEVLDLRDDRQEHVDGRSLADEREALIDEVRR